jgi:hypothetical protein
VVGGGPAGLIAAETLAAAGRAVTVYERMPSVGRKLLIAGRGGLNLTHSEPLPRFLSRYGATAGLLRPALEAFPPQALQDWAEGLGQKTFVGSSGRVFPESFKASPLLRAWLERLRGLGVRFALRHRFDRSDEGGRLMFTDPAGEGMVVEASATILALGGASWPRLGSDGSWIEPLRGMGLAVHDLVPANCGFRIGWSAFLRERFGGTPLKRIALSFGGETVPGEAVVTEAGIEGGAVYALSGRLRDAIAREGAAVPALDLRPDRSVEELAAALGRPRGKQSASTFLRKAAGLPPVGIALLHEDGGPLPTAPLDLARAIKAVPLRLVAPMPIERAISSAGGIALDELDSGFMLRRCPGIFAAGEMLDWEAPTGGYLLQASFATGIAAARGALAWLAGRETT